MTQNPSPNRPYPTPQHAKRLRPKTYSVAVYLVVGVVVLQAVMLISVFWLRSMVVTVSTKLPANMAVKIVPKDNLPRLSTSGPTNSARLQVPTANDALSQIETLNEEAQVFLKQNDFQSALDLLVRAEDIDPRHPTTLKNIAEIYNMTNNPVRSRIYWQRLVDLGPGVGTIYGVASDHVKLADSSHAADPLKENSTLPRVIYVDTVEKTPVETKDGNAQFRVRAVLKRRDPNMADFEQKKLQPYVIFYQQMPDGSLTPDLGQRKGSFDDTFLFWRDKDAEPFGVTYVMPVPGTPTSNSTPQGKYYGFVIGLYYDKVLQDVRSEPADLSARMALPQEIE